MFTGTDDIKEVPMLVEQFLSQGYVNIKIKKNSIGQWIVSTN